MADAPNVNIAHNSREEVAYKLMGHVLRVEKFDLHPGQATPDGRKKILDTYAECLIVVNNPHTR